MPDPLHYEIIAGEIAGSKELSLIMDPVRYSEFVDLDPPLALDTFLRLRNVVMMRRFFSLELTDMAGRLGIPVAVFQELVEHPHYAVIDAAIIESAKRLSKLGTIDDVVKDVEVRAAKEMVLLGVTSPASAKEKHKALESLADRRSPKQSRNSQPIAERVFPQNLVDLIGLALQVGQQVGQLPHEQHEQREQREQKVIDVTANATSDTPPGAVSPAPPRTAQQLALPAGAEFVSPADDDSIDAEVLNVPGGKPVPGI